MTIHPAIKFTETAWQAGTSDDDGYGFECCARVNPNKTGRRSAVRLAKAEAKRRAADYGDWMQSGLMREPAAEKRAEQMRGRGFEAETTDTGAT